MWEGGAIWAACTDSKHHLTKRNLSPTKKTYNWHIGKTEGCVDKLFDGKEGCGTLIFIGEALGMCAFPSVFEKKTNTLLESTLSVFGYGLELKFVNPTMDVAVYGVFDADNKDRESPYVELDSNKYVHAGNPIHLLSFPAFDSQTRDEEDDVPMAI